MKALNISKSRRGAMELSVGTIVVFVLAMSVLVLGFFLVQRIFNVATGAVDLTDQQLRDEINKLFADESRTTIYPGTREVEIRQGESDGIGIGIKNIQSTQDSFNYIISANPGTNCPTSFTKENAMSLITVGGTESGIAILSGDYVTRKVLFEPQIGIPLCTIRYVVEITSTNSQTFSDYFDIRILARRG